MSAKRMNVWSGLLGTVGATGLGLYQVKEGIERGYRLGDMVWQGVLWGSLALLVAAALLFVLARVRFDWSRTTYPPEGIARAAIPGYYRFIRQVLGDDVAPIERVYEWFDKNPEVLRAVYRETISAFSRRQDLIGFFTVFPVTRDCARLLAQNQIKGTGIGADQIVSRNRRPSALYIGAVGAVGWRGRERTVQALLGYVARWLDRRIPIYTRPTTEEGRRIAIKHHFVAIDPQAPLGESVYVRDDHP